MVIFSAGLGIPRFKKWYRSPTRKSRAEQKSSALCKVCVCVPTFVGRAERHTHSPPGPFPPPSGSLGQAYLACFCPGPPGKSVASSLGPSHKTSNGQDRCRRNRCLCCLEPEGACRFRDILLIRVGSHSSRLLSLCSSFCLPVLTALVSRAPVQSRLALV